MSTVAPTISSPQNDDIITVNVTNDITITCTASAVPEPTIEFYYNEMLLNRTEGEMGIGEEIPSRVQIGATTALTMIDDGTYQVSRDMTLFNVRDEPLTRFECRAMNIIPEPNQMLSDMVGFDIRVQGMYMHYDVVLRLFNSVLLYAHELKSYCVVIHFHSPSKHYNGSSNYNCCDTRQCHTYLHG